VGSQTARLKKELAEDKADYHKLDREYGEAKSRWENERVTLSADAMK
jgi:hypothetical protein